MSNKVVDIRVTERFDFSRHEGFRESYRNQTERGSTFKVDLSQTEYMDSSALGMLLVLKEHADAIGGRVVLVRPSTSVSRVLELTNFQTIFPIEA